MQRNLQFYIPLWMGIILFLFWSCGNNKSPQETIFPKKNAKDSIEMACNQLVIRSKEFIDKELNLCRVYSDCGAVYGTCPLGSFFIVNKKNEKLLDSIIIEVEKICGVCKYQMQPLPSTFICKNFKCYPGFNERSAVLMIIDYSCEKIVNLYSEELIGKKISSLHLNKLMYREILQDDTEAITSSDPESMNRVKVIFDKEGYVKSLDCDK